MTEVRHAEQYVVSKSITRGTNAVHSLLLRQ